MKSRWRMIMCAIVCSTLFVITSHVVLLDNRRPNSLEVSNPSSMQKTTSGMQRSRGTKSASDRASVMGRFKSKLIGANSPQLGGWCPKISRLLKGHITLHLKSSEDRNLSLTEKAWPPTLEYLQYIYKDIELGGVYRGPKNCRCRSNTAIIVPFRNRELHLRFFLFYIHPFLQQQQNCYKIIVVEQADDETFNKGKMMNTAFRYTQNTHQDFDCYIFHDVDMIAENDRNIYRCNHKEVVHYVWQMDKFNYSIPYYDYIGGVLGFTKDQFLMTNGFSNKYEGWGGEDDDMMERIWAKGSDVWRTTRKNIARYKMIPHDHDKGNPVIDGAALADLLKHAASRQDLDGLSSLETRVVSVQKYHTHTHLKVLS